MDYLPLSEVLQLKPYPTADVFPMLLDSGDPPAGYEGLTMPHFAGIILREGVRQPLVIWNGWLLDGRNRREAARIASKLSPAQLATLSFEPADLSMLPVQYPEFKDEEEADSYVLSLNINRRQMNKDQLACTAVQFWDATNLSETNQKRTREVLAQQFHVSEGYIQKARSLFLNDRAKFDKALSGKERVIGKLISPGQKIKPEKDPAELHLQQISDGFVKASAAIKDFMGQNDITGESKIKGVENIKIKYARLTNLLHELGIEVV